ncbi:XRE family transcriptional regulator [Lysinibacillus sp. BF-4]|uniref:helix-turn-helix domain-containing protein n=1 Tax=Lysinibacillus sp. BF-4 TaxID=1473546 RepID=UPI0005042308|nr:helix-turn-helix transcriptional regulator [Lysinibacillus sp. BF-4]KFL44567.1 XRE family transcriptional regulator [Lysinibacillus sp. BF-4]
MNGKRLKELRLNKKLTQEEVGKFVNVTKVSISGYENNTRSPDTETLQKLADLFQVSTDYILGRTDKQTIPNEDSNNDKEFKEWLNNPDLNVFYRELPKSEEDKIRQLREIWEIIKKK